jgi:DNA (cytosine-5)-methyltransferase 1
MRVVSLFSGVGGLDLGFVWEGHKIVWAIDNDPDAVNTYKRNIGNHIVLDDIRNIPSDTIPDCDIVIGGFPCQGFSIANTKRNAEDARNTLYLELLRVIQDKQPTFFLAENVKGLLSLDKGNALHRILADFDKANYHVEYKVLNAADFGVPQIRERVIFIGVQKNCDYKISFPKPTHSNMGKCNGNSFPFMEDNANVKKWVSIGEALKDIPEPEISSDIPNHTYSKYKLRFNGYIGHRKIDPNKPAPTVTARGDNRGGVVVLHHPSNLRRMSARELATTQSFPLDFVFECCQSSVYRQIGNAVPPLMARAIASVFPKKIKAVHYGCQSSKAVSIV